MSDEDLKKVEDLVRGMEKRLEQKLTDCLPSSSTPPPPPPTKGGNNLHGWKGVGIVVSVLSAIVIPVLAVTWYAADKMNQLESVQKDVDRTRSEVSSLRAQIGVDIAAVGADIAGMRKDVQRLREAFAAYTQVILPMFVQDDPPYRLPIPRPPVQPVPPSVP